MEIMAGSCWFYETDDETRRLVLPFVALDGLPQGLVVYISGLQGEQLAIQQVARHIRGCQTRVACLVCSINNVKMLEAHVSLFISMTAV